MRFLGLPEKAASIFAQMSEKDRKFLWAFAYGVNRGIQFALERTPVNRDLVTCNVDPLVGILRHLPVHLDTLLVDPTPRRGPRRQSGLREDTLQRLRRLS